MTGAFFFFLSIAVRNPLGEYYALLAGVCGYLEMLAVVTAKFKSLDKKRNCLEREKSSIHANDSLNAN